MILQKASQVKDTYEQANLTSNSKLEMKLNGIEIKNLEISGLIQRYPYNKAFIWNEAHGLCCVNGQIKLTPWLQPLEPHFRFPEMDQILL